MSDVLFTLGSNKFQEENDWELNVDMRAERSPAGNAGVDINQKCKKTARNKLAQNKFKVCHSAGSLEHFFIYIGIQGSRDIGRLV